VNFKTFFVSPEKLVFNTLEDLSCQQRYICLLDQKIIIGQIYVLQLTICLSPISVVLAIEDR
jgi:hypothetical protein